MSKTITKNEQITSGTSSIVIDLTDYYDQYRFYTSGSVTLFGALNVTASGTPQLGDYVKIQYDANLDFSGSTVKIFGVTIPEKLESVLGVIDCYYDGSAWVVKFLTKIDESAMIGTSQLEDLSVTSGKLAATSVTSGKIGTSAVNTTNIASSAVNADKISTNLKPQLIPISVSFETGELGAYEILCPFNCTLDSIYTIVTKQIEATDNGTISLNINGSPMVPNSIIMTAGSVNGTKGSNTITGSNTVTAGQVITLTTAKTTAGGKALLTLKLTRTT